MAGRFLFQSLRSRISSRSRTLFRFGDVDAPVPHVSDDGVGTFSSFIQGSAAHPSVPIPSNIIKRGLGTLNNVLRGAPAHPPTTTPGSSGLHGYAARYFNTLQLSCPAAKTSKPSTGMPSVITYRTKPALDGSVGVKPTFSASSSTKKAAFEPDSACRAKMEAESEAFAAAFTTWKTKLDKENASFDLFVNTIVGVWTLAGIYYVVGTLLASSRGSKGKSSQVAESDHATVSEP